MGHCMSKLKSLIGILSHFLKDDFEAFLHLIDSIYTVVETYTKNVRGR